MLTTLAISNYRTLREVVLPLGRLNVVTGANGSGKSNLYKALRLLAQTAQGGVWRSQCFSTRGRLRFLFLGWT